MTIREKYVKALQKDDREIYGVTSPKSSHI